MVKIIASVLLGFASGFALDISGKVVDKRFAPIVGAKVCNQSLPDNCVLSGSDGQFHLQGNVGLRVLASADPVHIHLHWFDADGRVSDLKDRGRLINTIPIFGDNSTNGSSLPSIEVSASKSGLRKKSAAPAGLAISKPGYANSSYQPSSEAETGDVILLGGEGETVSLLFDGKTLDGWTQIPAASWILKDSAMASTGAGRGVVYTKGDYKDFRVIFSIRQISGNHFPCVLFFTTRPPQGQNGLDALGGIQWQAPGVYGWDYRPGKNNSGTGLYTTIFNPGLNRNQWSQCEMLVHGATGEARMACCQQTGNLPCKGVEVLRFKDPTAGKSGPFALQMHNAGIYDEYKELSIESNPTVDSLYITR